jgi:hypothetical protein
MYKYLHKGDNGDYDNNNKSIIIIIIINCKWVDTHPVTVVNLHITYARTMKVDYSRFIWGGLHGKHAVMCHKPLLPPSSG